MEKLDVYDFDGTLYSKDSTIHFYLYCIKRNPKIIKYIPKLIIYNILFIIKMIKKEKLKESFFEFLKEFNNPKQIDNSFGTRIKNI